MEKTVVMSGLLLALVLGAGGCAGGDRYAGWPEAGSYFPYVYTPEEDLEEFQKVRFETETWDPETDLGQTAAYLKKALYHRPSAPRESLAHFDAMREKIPPLAGGVRLSFVGDLLWVGGNWDAFAQPAAHLLDGELRIGNLETPTSPEHTTDRSEMGWYQFNSPVEMLDGLPLDVLQLNNNHSLDFGDPALEATVREVEARGFVQTGVDRHASLRVGDLDIALLSYTWGINRRDLTSAHELFVVPFGHLDEEIELDGLERDVDTARRAADTVVVLVHWGFEYEYYPDPHFLVLARRIIAAGADLVVGQGPHTLQPAELCHVNRPGEVPGVGTCSLRTPDGRPRTAAVLYSLGNFSTFQDTWPLRSGMVATVSLDPDVTGLGWAPTVMLYDPERVVAPLEEHLAEPAVAEEAARLDRHLGTGWMR